MQSLSEGDTVTSAKTLSIANVIAVSRSTNRDQFDFSGFGNCMDLLAPSAGINTVGSGRGTLWATTTDMRGAAGYNNNAGSASCPTAEAAPPPANARDYTACFNGTSFATPLTAGVAGLILSTSPNLTRLQVQRLLQDTADKVEDSTGAYATGNGFSTPAGGNATHGWGRVNAFEAVRVAAPAAAGGRGGVDLVLRDNRLDWGNTEQPSNTLFEPTRGFLGHWRSEDIRVDAPPYRPAPTAATYETFADETPSAAPGDVNRVYVRVRNRGPQTASSVTVKLFWSQFGAGLAPLPADFWTAFPANSADPASRWNPLDCSTGADRCIVSNLAYSGGSVAGTAADASQIVRFDFPAPPIDPALPNHFCMLAMVDSAQDPISPDSRASRVVDAITPTDNNVTHRNYRDLDSTRTARFEAPFFVRNPTADRVRARLTVEAPRGFEVTLDPLPVGQTFSAPAASSRCSRRPGSSGGGSSAASTSSSGHERTRRAAPGSPRSTAWPWCPMRAPAASWATSPTAPPTRCRRATPSLSRPSTYRTGLGSRGWPALWWTTLRPVTCRPIWGGGRSTPATRPPAS